MDDLIENINTIVSEHTSDLLYELREHNSQYDALCKNIPEYRDDLKVNLDGKLFMC